MGRRSKKPISVHIDRLTPKGVAGPIISKPDRTAIVKGACFGDEVSARPARKKKATLLEVTQPSPHRVTPECPAFLQCGGCQLQHTPLEIQRREKQLMVERMINRPNAHFFPITGPESGYAYRNKLELSFGTRQFLSAERLALETENINGDFLGMHPWGWYSKIVPIQNCALISQQMNAVLEHIQSLNLQPAWNNYSHTGTWRHVVLREGEGVWVTLVTSSEATLNQVQTVAEQLQQSQPDIRGIVWVVNDGLADVATGETKAILYGSSDLTIILNNRTFQLPYDAFFQVNTKGTEIIIRILSEIYQNANGRLFDLYCGVGTLGISLAEHFSDVLGIEVHEQAVEVARKNATLNGVSGEWVAGTVETLLDRLNNTETAHILVDPPRVGLHPKVTEALAHCSAKSLVYVACSPASLARDIPLLEAGGWVLKTVHIVDLFSQTPHVETIALFMKEAA